MHVHESTGREKARCDRQARAINECISGDWMGGPGAAGHICHTIGVQYVIWAATIFLQTAVDRAQVRLVAADGDGIMSKLADALIRAFA